MSKRDGEDLLPLSCYERGVIEMLRKVPQVDAPKPPHNLVHPEYVSGCQECYDWQVNAGKVIV